MLCSAAFSNETRKGDRSPKRLKKSAVRMTPGTLIITCYYITAAVVKLRGRVVYYNIHHTVFTRTA